MKKIGLYPRISKEEPDFKKKNGSLSAQIHRMKEKVDQKNKTSSNGKWGKIIDIYKDDGFSGKNTKRPEFQRMLDDVRKGKIDTIMVTELSRISRSVSDFLKICNELNEYGCDFICLQIEGFDTTTPIGKFIITVMIALYELEREMTGERLSNNNYVRGKKGLAASGHPFLGYDRDNSTLVINEQEADIVRKIFDLYVDDDLKIQQIAKKLNSEGVVNKVWTNKKGNLKGGQAFDHMAIHRILNRFAYTGIREVNTINKNKDQEKLKENKRYFQTEANWPAIVDREKFTRAQDRLSLNKTVTSKAHHDFILTGILHCGECGKALFGTSPRGRSQMYHYYEHKKKGDCKIHRYPANELEKHVKKHLFQLINNECMREGFIKSIKDMNRRSQNKGSIKQDIEKQIKQLQEQKNHLVEVISRPEVGAIDALITKLKSTEDTIIRLEEEKAEVEIKCLQDAGNIIDASFIFEHIKLLRGDGFRKKNISFKRELIQSLIKSIAIHPDNVIKIEVFANENIEKGERSKPEEVIKEMPSFEDFGGVLADKNEDQENVLSIFGKKAYRLQNEGAERLRVGSAIITNGAQDWT